MAYPDNTPPKVRTKLAAVPPGTAHPAPGIESLAQVPYIDEKRDHRDLVVITAIRTAIEIIGHDDSDAADILQLALWKMESSWPVNPERKFTAEVARG